MRASLRRFALETLLGGDKEAEIVHGQCVYRLRLTAQGKLILTK
ncbi:MAG TPA: hemin uptake protein HemP [Burkholderiaceae bacterium]|nr:hemin uptake protein HemP [Burkholderiaceae bacterium]